MGTSLKTLIIFWRANMAYPWLFWISLASFVSGIILQKIGAPLVAALAINKLIEVHAVAQADYWAVLLPYIAGLGVSLIVAQALNDFGLIMLSKVEVKAKSDLEMKVFDLLMSHSLNFHANNFSGALVSQTARFTSAYINLTDVFVMNIPIMMVVSFVAIGVVAYFLPVIALAMAVWTVFFVWLNIIFTRKRLVLSRAKSAADSVLTAHLADGIGNIGTVKSFAHEDLENGIHDVKNQDAAKKRYKAWMLGARNDFMFGSMMAVLQVVVLVMLAYAATQSVVAFGTLLLVQVYITQLIGQLWGLSSITKNIEQSLADSAEMTEILHQELEIKDPAEPQELSVTKGEINLSNVTFTHDGNKRALFKNFSLQVKPGEKVGLVGHSGSGKTSLTKLLLRFADISSGTISIDGQDISKVRQADLRSRIAYVPQEPLLFHRSLYDNIAYGNPNATKRQVEQAAKQAYAHDFIKSLPNGYETMVGERGVKLSGGQRQRIAIARAILKNAPILVLDEATSALDSESEQVIQDALWQLMKDRTAIAIAHRLSTIQRMDRIVVMADGKIMEQGTHKELLANKGIYSHLWARQSGGFIEE